MDKDTRKVIEQALLAEIDQLIECGIDASQADADRREELLTRGQEMVQRILGLLTQIFFGPGEYYDTILKQLVSQKLPSNHVLASFGDFPNVLEEIIAAGITRFTAQPNAEPAAEERAAEETEPARTEDDESLESPEELPETDKTYAQPTNREEAENQDYTCARPTSREEAENQVYNLSAEEIPVGLARSLRLLYPRALVLKDYILKNGHTFPYFLPDHNLAFEIINTDRPDIDRRKLHICQQNGITLVRISPEDAGEHKRIQREIRRQTRVAKK